MGVEQEFKGEFPIGMRVLAVDDDRVCLKLIGELLRKCKYNVTTTPHATTALKLLRENPDHFDLMISDVHMPDMDGFKLLELVGLEMDIPVIMLSANDETKAVMKGINHGARDYLLKPVRIEELKNIWQHVIRKNIKSKESGSSGQGDLMILPNLASNGQTEGSPKPSRKHRDHDEVDEEADDHSNDESSSQKKPRVVWTKHLHQLFLDAVRSLGDEEKAVPKRILERMNVPWLTRENVASHLQKYRIYLKKHLRSDVTQQCNFDPSIQHVNHSSSYMRQSSFLNQQIPGISFPSFGTHCPSRGNYVGNPGSSVIHFNQVHNYNFDINFGAPFSTSPAEQTGLLRIQNLPADVKVENKTASPIEDSLNALTMNNVNQIPNVLPAKQNPFQNAFLSSNTGSLRTSSLVPGHDVASSNLQNGISLLGCSSRQNSVAVQSDASYPGSVQDSSRTSPLSYVDSSVVGSNPTTVPSFDLPTGSKLAIAPGSESEGATMSYRNILPQKTVPVLCASEAVDLHPMQDTVPELGFHNQTSDSLFDVDTAESFMHESIFPLLHHQEQDLANCGISSWDLDDSANGGVFMLNHDVNEFRTGMVGRTRSSSLDVLESQRSSRLDNSAFGDGLLSTVVKQKYGVGSWK